MFFGALNLFKTNIEIVSTLDYLKLTHLLFQNKVYIIKNKQFQ